MGRCYNTPYTQTSVRGEWWVTGWYLRLTIRMDRQMARNGDGLLVKLRLHRGYLKVNHSPCFWYAEASHVLQVVIRPNRVDAR